MSSAESSPLDGLVAAGATFKKFETSSSSSFQIQGIEMGGSTTFGSRYKWTLPVDSSLQVIFSPEKFSKKVVKIFKKELQVGDELFDGAVYIDTKNKDATKAFLQDAALRDLIFGVVAQGGTIAIDGATLVYQVVEADTPPETVEAEMAKFVAAVMNYEPSV